MIFWGLLQRCVNFQAVTIRSPMVIDLHGVQSPCEFGPKNRIFGNGGSKRVVTWVAGEMCDLWQEKSMEWRLGSKKRLVQELEIEVEVFFQRQITSDTLFICHLILSTIFCKNYKETNVHAHTDAIHDQWWHLVVVSESLRHKHRSCPKLQDSEWEVDVTSACASTELFCAWKRVSLHIHFERDLTTRRSLFNKALFVPFPQKLSGYGCCFCSWHDI